jgi:hypothetical protein
LDTVLNESLGAPGQEIFSKKKATGTIFIDLTIDAHPLQDDTIVELYLKKIIIWELLQEIKGILKVMKMHYLKPSQKK